MSLIDTHAHLDEQSIEVDRDDVIVRALAAGVQQMITIGTTLASSQQAIQLATAHPAIFAAVGIHPNYVSQAGVDDWSEIQELVTHPRVVGIGETGLDQYWDYAPLDQQIDYFQRHLELSRISGKPFIVHCRDAEPQVLDVLQAAARKSGGELLGVMHSFCGSEQSARICLELGMYLSFAGMLTYKRNEDLRQLARTLPLDRLLVETDTPYLSPVPLRGKRNEPANVVHTARCLAELKGLTLDELAAATTENARRLFSLPA